MAEVIWTQPALQELDAIADYIALDNPQAARRLVRQVFEKARQLETFPRSGRMPPELSDTTYRELLIAPCRIFYRIENDNVLIIHNQRQEQLLRNYMLEIREHS